ncbi:MAG TPA: Uma2 family endonuclease [Streptosporangiaceae bacterium]|nr:Uma2 family endonuclease [Streptosporangiaceae bacterium]
MTIADAWPTTSREFTVDDLDRTPDDGRRYELVDGALIVSPAPTVWHQIVLGELLFELRQVCPKDQRVLPGPGVRMSIHTELIPDIVSVRFADLSGPRITEPPLLAVEVRSPSTALFDLNTKKAVYERFGIESYWIVVPDADQPELVAFELRDGSYRQVARALGDEPFRAERPFSVEIVPSRLVAGLLSS